MDVILGLGTIVVTSVARLCARNFGIKKFYLPNTAVILLFGMFFGGLTYSVPIFEKVAKGLERFAREDIVPGLSLFMPAYIFKTVFFTNWVEFKKSWVQIVILGSLGYFLSAFILGFLFSFLVGFSTDFFGVTFMRGAILSALDPGDLLSGLGEIKQVRTLLEGEALISNSLSTMFHKILVPHEGHPWLLADPNVMGFTFWLLLVAHIAVCWILSKISIVFVRWGICDTTTYICVSIALGYILYYISESFFSFIYPVVSVIAFAMMIRPARNYITPEFEEAINQFWDLIYSLTSSFVCFSMGIKFVRSSVELNDPGGVALNILLLYLSMLLTRCLAILVSFPLLKYTGLGISLETAVALAWGSLRGTICLGLIMFGYSKWQTKRRSYGVGAVFLNQLINGTTLRALLLRLGFFAPSRISNLSKALRNIEREKQRTIERLRRDESFANIHWDMVDRLTTLHQTKFSMEMAGRGSDSSGSGQNECKKCLKAEDLTPEQLETIKLEARYQILKAQMISYTGQFARGLILGQSFNILAAEVESAFHLPTPAVKSPAFHRYWILSAWARWMHKTLTRALGDWSAVKSEDSLTTPSPLQSVVGSILWGWYVQATVVVHFAFSVYTVATINFLGDFPAIYHSFSTIIIVFVTIPSVLEFTVYKFAKRRALFSAADVVTIFCAILMNVYVSLGVDLPLFWFISINLGRTLRVIRVYDMIILTRRTVPQLMAYLDQRLSHHFLVGYDAGIGFIRGQDETLKLISRIVTQPQVRAELKAELEEDRRVVLEEIRPIAYTWPVAIVSLKTRQCANHVLSAMKTEVLHLQQGGLLDTDEAQILVEEFKELKSRVRQKVRLLAPRNVRDVISQLSWLEGQMVIARKISSTACLWTLSRGDRIVKPGDDFAGILVVISGLAKSLYTPNRDLDRARSLIGQLPCVDHLRSTNYNEEQVDYVWDGMVIGEISALTGRRHDVLITCETSVVICVLTQYALADVLPTIRPAIWKTVAMRIISTLLPTTDGFEAWPQERIKAYLARGRIVSGEAAQALHTAQFVSDVFLLDGLAADVSTKTIYRPPCLIPRTVRNIYFPLSKKFKVPDGVPPTMLLAVPPMGIDHINVITDEGGVMRLQGGTAACPVHDVAAHTSMG